LGCCNPPQFVQSACNCGEGIGQSVAILWKCGIRLLLKVDNVLANILNLSAQ
jgi:hypothetical protein